jgi:hypothetical protein
VGQARRAGRGCPARVARALGCRGRVTCSL